jgi:hypothetical protein
MSDSAFFKVKSSKRSNPESRTTLDAIHHQKVQQLMEQSSEPTEATSLALDSGVTGASMVEGSNSK